MKIGVTFFQRYGGPRRVQTVSCIQNFVLSTKKIRNDAQFMEILDQNLLLKKSKEGFDELYHNSI